MPKPSSVYLNVGFTLGVDFDEALSDAIVLSGRLGVPLRGEMNNCPVFVFPGDTLPEARERLETMRKVMKG